MPLIKTVTYEAAEGPIKQMYDVMMERASMIPKPMQMRSASPALFEHWSRNMRYYMEHPSLSVMLLAHIRLLVAFNHQYPYCIDLNSKMLQSFLNLSDDEIAAVRTNPELARLDNKDKAMLVFVVRSMQAPEDIEATDIEHLQTLGWTDADIFDAVSYGADMISSGILFHVFKMADA